VAKTPRKTQFVRRCERIQVGANGALRVAVVADTHSALHPRALTSLAALKPDVLLHAGDIGDLRVLGELATLCPVFAIRGNVDVRRPDLADILVVDIALAERLLLRILLLHVAVYGPKLRGEVAKLAQAENATLVVCGHSHVPFIGRDRGIAVFNPGSAGPRRFDLPILFGTLDVDLNGVHLRHFDCNTGEPWSPG